MVNLLNIFLDAKRVKPGPVEQDKIEHFVEEPQNMRIMKIIAGPAEAVILILFFSLPLQLLAFLGHGEDQLPYAIAVLLSSIAGIVLLRMYLGKLDRMEDVERDVERGIPEDIGSYEALKDDEGKHLETDRSAGSGRLPLFPEYRYELHRKRIFPERSNDDSETVKPLDMPGLPKYNNYVRVVNPDERELADVGRFRFYFWISFSAFIGVIPLWYYWLSYYSFHSILAIVVIIMVSFFRSWRLSRKCYHTVKPYIEDNPFPYPYSNRHETYKSGDWEFVQDPSQCKLCGKHP